MGEDLPRRAGEGDAPVVKHDDAIRELGDVFHRVGDHEDGNAAGMECANVLAQVGRPARVESGDGFVEDEDLGLHGEDAAQGNESLLSAREVEGGGTGLIDDAEEFELLVHAARDFFLGKTEVARTVGDVLGHGLGEELALGALHHEADLAAKLAAALAVSGRDATYADFAGLWIGERACETGDRGLAGTRLADEGDELTARKLEGEAVKGGGGAVREADV